MVSRYCEEYERYSCVRGASTDQNDGQRSDHMVAFSLPGLAGNIAAMLHYMKTHYITVQSRGTLALPVDLRRRLHLDEPGAQLQIVEQDDGRVELRSVLPVRADQRWFWTERWQAMEREVDAHVAAGRVTLVDGPDALFEHLDASSTD